MSLVPLELAEPSPDTGLVERLRAASHKIGFSEADCQEAADALEAKDAEIAEWAKAGTRWSEKMSETQAEIEYWRSLYRNACKDRSEVQAEIENMRMVLDDTARDRNEAQAEVERLKAQLKPLDDLREMGVWDDES
jgi:peptidoglycan hydrolase CwlO-like protein